MQAYACGRLENPHLCSDIYRLMDGLMRECGTGVGRGWGNLSYILRRYAANQDKIVSASQNDAKIESANLMENVQQLTRCPKCGKRLYGCGHIQICNTCGYWTLKGTARMDSIVVI